ncbi:MAG: DEAD/DEAH box helicase [Rhodospirillaceae bacterium]
MLFSDLGLGLDVLRAVEDAGYTKPTPIQEQAIPVVLQGRDIFGCAQTGTGKTASFTLPMIDILASGRARARMPRSLILEPTRELAAQVAENFDTYGKHNKLNHVLLIGGEAFGDQVRKLDRGVDVLIATPGRMMDLFDRGNILLSDIKIFVIDEADRMLDMGFIPDIERIVSLLPRLRQTLMFSATMPPEIRRLADAFLINPKQISVDPPASPAETVEQNLVMVERDDKRKVLRHLLRTEDVKNALIFCNRKRDVTIIYRSLEKHGFNVGSLHGDMPQNKRTETLEQFKAGQIALLVCSDVAARGLDIVGLSHVFNFDVPISPEDYVHRIGRTGRAGKTGRTFMLATAEDRKQLASITRLIKKEIPCIVVEGLENAEPGLSQDPVLSQDSGRPSRDRPSRERPVRARGGQERARESSEVKEVVRERISAPRVRAAAAAAAVGVAALNPVPGHGRESLIGGRMAIGGRRVEPRSCAESDSPRRHRYFENDDKASVVGFGDHMPAFLLRPARQGSVLQSVVAED